MKSTRVKVTHKVGLHARPASLFVKTVQESGSEVTVAYNGKTVNARSLLALMSLGVNQNAEIEISAVGEDEEAVITNLVEMIDDNFGEKRYC